MNPSTNVLNVCKNQVSFKETFPLCPSLVFSQLTICIFGFLMPKSITNVPPSRLWLQLQPPVHFDISLGWSLKSTIYLNCIVTIISSQRLLLRQFTEGSGIDHVDRKWISLSLSHTHTSCKLFLNHFDQEINNFYHLLLSMIFWMSVQVY